MPNASDRSLLLEQYFDYMKWGVVLLLAMVTWLLSEEGVGDWPGEEYRGVFILTAVTLVWSSWSAFLSRLRSCIADAGHDTVKDLRLTYIPWCFTLVAIFTVWYAVFDKALTPEVRSLAEEVLSTEELSPEVRALAREVLSIEVLSPQLRALAEYVLATEVLTPEVRALAEEAATMPAGEIAVWHVPWYVPWLALVLMLAVGGLFAVFRQRPAAQQAD